MKKEALEVPKIFKDKRKHGLRNIVQDSAANVSFLRFFHPTFTSSLLSAMFTGPRGPPEKLSLTLVQCLNILRMIVRLAYTTTTTTTTTTEIEVYIHIPAATFPMPQFCGPWKYAEQGEQCVIVDKKRVL